MPSSRNNSLTEDLAKNLESATTLMQDLLGDIRGNSLSLTELKIKLESLTDNVEVLSHIIRDGNGKGSMITRLALVEKSSEDIDKDLDEVKNKLEKLSEMINEMIKEEKSYIVKDKEFKKEQLLARVKLFGMVAPGIIALIILLIKIFSGVE